MKKILKGLFHWSGNYFPNIGQMLVAMLGITVPIIFGVITGFPQLGIFISFGGLALSSEGNSDHFGTSIKALLFASLAGVLAFLAGSIISKSGTLWILPAIIFAVSLISGISRPFARSATIFLLFMIIASGFGPMEVSVLKRTLFFLIGAVWTLLLAVVFWPVRRLKAETQAVKKSQKYSFSQLLVHWRKSLGSFKGWQYTLRITLCAVIAVIVILVFPMRHSSWILLTIGIVVQRNSDHLLNRMLQRGIGTMIGAMLLSFFTSFIPSFWILVPIIAVLAGVRVYLKESNYLFYAIVMTALVVILIDFGKELSYQVMLDRLIATTIGCSISLVFGYLVWLKLIGSKESV